ncbi:MAG: PLP-dependent lyase/thiolase [Ilumatobacteraceae bacterium]
MTVSHRPVVTGMVCAACGAAVPIGANVLTCPRSSATDRHHVLHFVSDVEPFRPEESDNPFLAYRRWLAADAFGEAVGVPEHDRISLIEELDARVAAVAGTGFRRTPLARDGALSQLLGFSDAGGVWVKDETQNVAGSHKARHLFTELLQLVFAERAGVSAWSVGERPRLAIASCGNAAIAASTLARAVDWPIDVFVPPSASETVIAELERLGADIRICPRRDDDPAGDPCVLRFREATARGSVPFGVQGTENVWCRDGGRTIGWEITDVMDHRADRVFVQVGGGAFAACVGDSFRTSGLHPRLHAVQAEGCAPLARAWERALATGGAAGAGRRWDVCMWPWGDEPHSMADGILDDETYDWVGVVEAMASTGGSPVVASEANIVSAHRLGWDYTSIRVSATGTAGLAGVIAMREQIADDENVVVIFSGVQR